MLGREDGREVWRTKRRAQAWPPSLWGARGWVVIDPDPQPSSSPHFAASHLILLAPAQAATSTPKPTALASSPLHSCEK